jgi:hypothetical protein
MHDLRTGGEDLHTSNGHNHPMEQTFTASALVLHTASYLRYSYALRNWFLLALSGRRTTPRVILLLGQPTPHVLGLSFGMNAVFPGESRSLDLPISRFLTPLDRSSNLHLAHHARCRHWRMSRVQWLNTVES